ncbi:MAG: acetolactate decarboxylase, partial [Prochlorococcus sp.]
MSLSEQGENLLSAASHQVEFDHQNLSGTMVGFWSPSYASSLNIPGYHFHFVSDDLRHGGHVLDQSAVLSADVNVELQLESDLRLALPQTNAFMEADLSRDPTALLSVAEALSE